MLLKFIVIFNFLTLTSQIYAKTTFDWIAYGDIRGHIEPCGCDPKTDLGGILRVGKSVMVERSASPNLLVFDLGNNISPKENTENTNHFINLGLAKIHPDASLYNYLEFEKYKPEKEQRQFVLSNLKKPNSYTLQFVKKNNILIFGFLWREKIKQHLKPYDARLFYSNSLKIQNSLKRVLLYSGPDSILSKIIKSNIFDLILSSNRSHIKQQVNFKEKLNPQLLYRLEQVRMVPLGGAGYLRGGPIAEKKPQSLTELLSLKTTQPQKLNIKETFKIYDLIWLTQKYNRASPLQSLMDQYKKHTSNEYHELKKTRLLELKTTQYSGSAVCQGCHQTSYKIWKNSKHAHAFSILQKKKQEQNPNCISCHVLGWNHKGGFVGPKETPEMIGVNCENCHGPSKTHAQNPYNKKPPHLGSPTMCLGCHNETHSPSFNHPKYWGRIQHGKD